MLIFIMPSISIFDFMSVAGPDTNIFLYILASAAYAEDVNPNVIKTLLPNDLTTFFINGNAAFSKGLRSLTGNPPECIILDN